MAAALHLPHSSLDDILNTAQAAATAPGADVVFPAGKGPVVADASDGHTYRIGTAAGVLTVTQVT